MPKRKTTKPPKFTLSRVGSALDDAKQVPVVLRAKLTAILEQTGMALGPRTRSFSVPG